VALLALAAKYLRGETGDDAGAIATVYAVERPGCRTAWIPVVRNTTINGNGVGASDQCGNGRDGMLDASLAVPGVKSGDYAGWRFNAPAAKAISAVTATWQGRGDTQPSTGGPRS